jgi:mRNA-degrading endonuclease RelE of RelBE toxin-antitoxin system
MRSVELTPDAVRQFKALPKGARPAIKEALHTHLVLDDPARATPNKFRLRRASTYADYELRVDDWRIFYRIEGDMVVVTLLGEKRGNRLIVEGEELNL